MTDESHDDVTERLNLVGGEAARCFIQYQCRMFWWWDMIREMVEQDASKEDVLHCFDVYRKRLECMTVECGEWNERIYEITKEVLPGLERTDVEHVQDAMRALYGNDQVGSK